ncbi:hypothetical protein CI238_05209 [Colletotrichum incanum]|uniref:Uncharacterized protein n=1 Tax=Colletotrichum incanum TaxID=1573173 RepID=A0A167DZ80_COLIC|nr:hypothetical protein CI238_05209 [Colletotrichum incanum]OHW99775.1 hypothetical protein CSPAE12_01485 [Colletotrichum incanum]
MASSDLKHIIKAMQHLQLPLVAKKKTPPIPYEIVLHFIDALIDLAADPNNKLTWWLSYEHTVNTKLVVFDNHAGLKSESALKRRFDKIRQPSQINKKSRALVHRLFPRIYMKDVTSLKTNQLAPIQAWVRPKIDSFVPFFGCHHQKPVTAERFFKQAVVLPTPSGFGFLQLIRQIWLPNLSYLSELNRSGLRPFYRLPNLKAVMVDTTDTMARDDVMHPGRLPIDEDVFSCLAHWYSHSAVFNRIWTELNNSGVRLYALVDGAQKNPVAELFPTQDGIRMRFLHPNCTCCNHNGPKYSTIYHD